MCSPTGKPKGYVSGKYKASYGPPGWFVQTLNVHTAIYDDIEAEEADGEEVETEDEEGEEAEVEAVAAAAAAAAATDFFRFLISFSSSMSCASMISNSSRMVGSSRI
jgi:hypothetical protein